MTTYPTDYWAPRQAASLGSKMKVQDLHMIYNPVSQLLKVFDAQGRMVKQVFATARATSRGMLNPGGIVGGVHLDVDMKGDPTGPEAKIEWVPPQGHNYDLHSEKWWFVRTDYPTDDLALSTFHVHMWEMDKASFPDLWMLLNNCRWSGGTVHFEIAGRHMVREDVLYALEHA